MPENINSDVQLTLRQAQTSQTLTDTERMVANLVGQVVGDIRIRFGVLPGMYPTRVIDISDAVGTLLIARINDAVKRIADFDIRKITDAQGRLDLDPQPEPQTHAEERLNEIGFRDHGYHNIP